MVTLTATEWVISLYDYSVIADPPPLFGRFYEAITQVFSSVGIDPTHFAVEGKGFSGRAQRARGKALAKLLARQFEAISVLNLAAVPQDSEAPAYDRFANASLSIAPHGEALLVLALNQGIIPFGSDHFEHVIKQLVGLHHWASGYAFADALARQPEFHALGLDDGQLTDYELDALTKWYVAPPQEKMLRTRSVYPYNLLNRGQLSQPVGAGRTLRAFIEHEGMDLVEIGNLCLWRVPQRDVGAVRAKVEGSQAFIAC